MDERDVTVVPPETAIVVAALPYVGQWRMNPHRSDLKGTTISFENFPNGEWESSFDGMTYRFRMDEKDYATGMGDTAAWNVIDRRTWQNTWKSNERTLSIETLTLGADGNTLIVTNKGTKPNGEPIDDSTTFQRGTGGSGLEGRWVSTSVNPGSPLIIEFIPAGEDRLTFRQPAWEVVCEARLDGQDYPCVTPLGPGWTMAMTRAGTPELEMILKKDAKPVLNMTFRVSEDGSTLTQISETIGTNEKTRIVYDRQ